MQQDLIKTLYSTARWRQTKIDQFPHDRRNVEAESLLTKLARDLAAMPPDDPLLLELEQLCTPDTTKIIADKIRQCGFRGHYRDAHELLTALVRASAADSAAQPAAVVGDDVNPFL